MARETVKIFDTTLRDGLRNSGIILDLAGRVRFARQLERLRVDVIEIGFGGPYEVESMRAIAQSVVEPVVVGLARVNRKDVDRVLQGVGHAKHPGINIFSPSSDSFLGHAGASREAALKASAGAVAHARRHVDHVQFSAQDASRADPEYLAALLTEAVVAGANVLSIADTVSHAAPENFGALCRELHARVPGGDKITWSVHCHDERGHAVANCLAAIGAGVRQVECTVSGAGEGAGNTSLERLLEELGPDGPIRVGLLRERLEETAALLRELSEEKPR
jgi:2-isopropylmalate synthase